MEAAEELLKGLRREIHGRLKRERPQTLEGIGKVLTDVEKIWTRIARENKVLRPNGLRKTTFSDKDFQEALEAVGAGDSPAQFEEDKEE